MFRPPPWRRLTTIGASLVAALALAPAMLGVLAGADAHTVVGTSMQPTAQPGDVILVDADRPVTVGAIVAMDGMTGPARGDHPQVRGVVHRVVDRDTQGRWVTQGDDNARRDPGAATDADVAGVVVATVPLAGMLHLAAIDGQAFAYAALGAGLVALGVATRRPA